MHRVLAALRLVWLSRYPLTRDGNTVEVSDDSDDWDDSDDSDDSDDFDDSDDSDESGMGKCCCSDKTPFSMIVSNDFRVELTFPQILIFSRSGDIAKRGEKQENCISEEPSHEYL